MAAVVAIIMGGFACYEPIEELIFLVKPCSWQGVSLIIATTVLVVSIIGVFAFGLLTIRSHASKIGYKSKWFLPQSTKEYSFDEYKEDVLYMIVNMAAELYKLNDINRQKSATYKWAIRSFSASLIAIEVICVLFLFSVV